jgi:hypothetical protein
VPEFSVLGGRTGQIHLAKAVLGVHFSLQWTRCGRQHMDDSGGAPEPEAQNLIAFDGARHSAMPIMFDRRELMAVLSLYSRMVAAGEWKDYAIDSLRDCAVFSVFRRASETPLYRIEKTPRLSRKQGAFSVVNANGIILKRGHELGSVLRVFDRSLRLVEN